MCACRIPRCPKEWGFGDTPSRWHAAHGHSQSYGRYLADLEVLKTDLGELGPNDSHTLYYLGVTHLSAHVTRCQVSFDCVTLGDWQIVGSKHFLELVSTPGLPRQRSTWRVPWRNAQCHQLKASACQKLLNSSTQMAYAAS